ncbi:hypothetical protein, partial [Geminicoccus flavidas]|uniref:hypothetical protein n=1 Tax=Geminicoccus flavidas TaxID=2506407 RepID=UPI001F4569AF
MRSSARASGLFSLLPEEGGKNAASEGRAGSGREKMTSTLRKQTLASLLFIGIGATFAAISWL